MKYAVHCALTTKGDIILLKTHRYRYDKEHIATHRHRKATKRSGSGSSISCESGSGYGSRVLMAKKIQLKFCLNF
jgi:hypothetical protein